MTDLWDLWGQTLHFTALHLTPRRLSRQKQPPCADPPAWQKHPSSCRHVFKGGDKTAAKAQAVSLAPNLPPRAKLPPDPKGVQCVRR